MNRNRRKRLAKALNLIREASVLLEEIRDEEQECFDNLPEGLQSSEKGEVMEENVEMLEDIISSLEDLEDLENM